MMGLGRGTVWLLLLLATATPLAAQTLEELDAISDQTANEEPGLEAAREHIARGRLLEALATLERVLTLFPRSAAARFDHAQVLCWLDDRQGALAEFARLDEDDYAKGALDQARETCRIESGEGTS
jgi:tetratricopeptide (TPR) repeat protein